MKNPVNMTEYIETLSELKKINQMQKLLGAEDIDMSCNNTWDGDYFTYIVTTLEAAGWKNCDDAATSACCKAHFETNLEKDGIRANIVVAHFMGIFTQITLMEGY
jgi:hypothetical protein